MLRHIKGLKYYNDTQKKLTLCTGVCGSAIAGVKGVTATGTAGEAKDGGSATFPENIGTKRCLLARLPLVGISGKLTGDTRLVGGGDSRISVCGDVEPVAVIVLFLETFFDEKSSKEENGNERGGGCGLKVLKLALSAQISS